MNLLLKGMLLSTGFLLLMLYCSPSLTDGNGSGVGSGKTAGIVNGMFYKPDGITPACGAVVEVRSRNITAVIATDGINETGSPHYRTVTNNNGYFAFDTIDSGLYVIEGNDNQGNMVLLDSIRITTPAETLTLSSAILEPAGAIRGMVSLNDDSNPLQVFVLAFGIDRFSQVKADGSFLFSGLAAGVYKLKILSIDPEYGPKDTSGITVISNDTINLGTVKLPLRKQQVPELKVGYDPYLIQATLTWSCEPQSAAKGYNIYRFPRTVEESDSVVSMSRPLNTRLVNETVFIDSFKNFSNELEFAESGFFLQQGLHFTYRVSVVDSTDNEGPLSNEVEVILSSVLEPFDSIQFEVFPEGADRGLLTLNNNNEFILLLNRPVGVTGGSTDIYRYSRDGHILSTWQFPESIVGNNWIGTVKSNDTTGICFFTVNTGEETILYKVLPNGVFLDTFSIGEKCMLSVIANNVLFFLTCDQANTHVIKKVDLQTGVKTQWREYPGSCIEMLYPFPDGRIGTELSTLDNGNIKKDFICLDPDGTELFSIPLQNSCFITACDSLFIFSDKCYNLAASGTMCHYRIIEDKGNLMLGTDGTVYTFLYDTPGKILLSRFPNDCCVQHMSGRNEPVEGL
jgi:hypothetical protein